jgi:hypothetical protein
LATIVFSINAGITGRFSAFYGEVPRAANLQWHAAANDPRPPDSRLLVENALGVARHAGLPSLWINQAAVQFSLPAIENGQAGKLDEPDSDQLIQS